MTGGESHESVSDADVTTFSQKLHAWAESLTPAEQTLLQRLMTRAAGETDADDTQGYIVVQREGLAACFPPSGTSQESPLLLRGLGLNLRGYDPGGGIGRQ